ncbi:hypothetical protein EB061_06525 [bacterium]|jgi:hypothetical protein|nr:hypothetical protein [bacterium]
MRNSGSNLLGYLPPHSFAMGKVLTQPFCVSCGAASHLVLRQDSDSPFLILAGPIPEGSPEKALLLKILEAMKLDPSRLRLWELDSPVDALPAACREVLLRECLDARAGVLIAFGPLTTRTGVIERGDWKVLVTEGLAEMVLQPELKKIAWEELRSALAAARREAET